jgi:aminopeptidase N
MSARDRLGRVASLRVASYDLSIDLTGGRDTFRSLTEIRFGCSEAGASAVADLSALDIGRADLNGTSVRHHLGGDGRLYLHRLDSENTLVVEAEFGYATPGGVGLIRGHGPDGSAYACSRAYPGGAPHMFCCFDTTDARAPVSLSVLAPGGWTCVANGLLAGRSPDGTAENWTFASTRPIAPYLFSMCAGLSAGPSFACARADGSRLPVSTYALPSVAGQLAGALTRELFQQPLSFYEQSLGVPHPDRKWDIAFVPEFTALAFGAPGLLTVREAVLSRQEDPEVYLATVFGHELGHAWFGGVVEFQPPADDWLEEAVVTYIGRSALAARYPGVDPWSASTSRMLPDDGYARGAARLRELETVIGRRAVMDGLGRLVRNGVYRPVSRTDLVCSWSAASGRDLSGWAATELHLETSGGA